MWRRKATLGQHSSEVTSLLRLWSGGDSRAQDELVPLIYQELRRVAHYHLRRERKEHTLQTTALVHEVYLRLCSQSDLRWEDRARFFAVASSMMRHILVDYSRRRAAEKRGVDPLRLGLDEALHFPLKQPFDLVLLDRALEQLTAFDSRKCQVMEMRFFVGLSAKEIALVLKTSEATIRRDWTIAKAWLFRNLDGSADL
ncbi:MAG: ECF-type sigma factor [Bryobacteraceae bacterium]